MLKEKIALEEKTPQVSTIWRASGVGECENYLCHVRLGHEPLPLAGRVRHLLDDGVTHERDIMNRLRASGVTVMHSYAEGQVEVTCSLIPLVTGHPDGVLDVPKDFPRGLDYADENFKYSRFMLLEVTAPSHFTFQRLRRSHMRETLWRKYVQIMMYLNSEEIRSYGNCCIVEVKNKNTSELYEEGVSFNIQVVDETLEKLKRVEDMVFHSRMSEFRCDDWRRDYCRYKHLCFEEVELPSLLESQDILRGESLSEAEQLIEVAEVWRKGKLLKLEGEDLIADSRDQFAEIIRQYGCRGLTIMDVRALMVPEGVNRRTNYDLLRGEYLDVYDKVVTESIREAYVRVSD